MSDDAAPQAPETAKKMRRRRVLATVVVGALVLGFAVFSNYGIVSRVSLNGEKSELQDSLRSLRRIQDSLRAELKKMQFDTFEIERIAREKYGMVEPGEQVYIIESKDKEKKK